MERKADWAGDKAWEGSPRNSETKHPSTPHTRVPAVWSKEGILPWGSILLVPRHLPPACFSHLSSRVRNRLGDCPLLPSLCFLRLRAECKRSCSLLLALFLDQDPWENGRGALPHYSPSPPSQTSPGREGKIITEPPDSTPSQAMPVKGRGREQWQQLHPSPEQLLLLPGSCPNQTLPGLGKC